MIKCLAIDDDALFLKLLKVFFEDMESAELISTYSNSVEGVMACVKQKPDVLLLDLEMPYLDGFETLATLDNPPKVIVISGHLNGVKDIDFPIDKFISKSEVKASEDLEKAIMEVMKA
ncbi:MAG: response regulator [Marinoscillum sp.]